MRGAQYIRKRKEQEPRFNIGYRPDYCLICGNTIIEKATGNMTPYKCRCANGHTWGKNILTYIAE